MSQNKTQDIILVNSHRTSCDGGGGALGHPMVWMEMGADGEVVCKYCDKRFVQRGGPKDPDIIGKSGL